MLPGLVRATPLFFAASGISSSEQIKFSSFYISFPVTFSLIKLCNFLGQRGPWLTTALSFYTNYSPMFMSQCPSSYPVQFCICIHKSFVTLQSKQEYRRQTTANIPKASSEKHFQFWNPEILLQTVSTCILDFQGRRGREFPDQISSNWILFLDYGVREQIFRWNNIGM